MKKVLFLVLAFTVLTSLTYSQKGTVIQNSYTIDGPYASNGYATMPTTNELYSFIAYIGTSNPSGEIFRWTLYYPQGNSNTPSYTLYEGKQPYMYFSEEGYYRLTLQVWQQTDWSGVVAERSFYIVGK